MSFRNHDGSASSRLHRVCAMVVLAACACFGAGPALAATFTVNSAADVPDSNAGDGVCRTAANNSICTLRAALQEANALAGADKIVLQANVTYTLSLTDGSTVYDADMKITDSVTIVGAGPGSTIIDGNGSATGHGVFIVDQCIHNATNCADGSLSASISGVTIKNGVGPNIAGGIKNYGALTLDSVAITDNAADGINDWGGGIYNAGSLTMTNCLLANNRTGSSNAYGGGMYSQGPLTIVDSTISGNRTYSNMGFLGYGGGLFLIGDQTTIRNTAIEGNSGAVGGGIYHAGYPLTLIGDTLSGNSSDGNGGGFYNASGTTSLINATVSGNSSGGDGGGVYNKSGTTGLYNVTVAQNHANADDSGFNVGGGVANAAAGTVTLINSIIAGNTVIIPTTPYPTLASDDCSGTLTSQGYNIVSYIDSNTCNVGGPKTVTDPNLGPLQFNGGPTQTHAIAPGSPAVDTGNPSGCTDDLGATIPTDQRGVPRPYGAACDIGAFEYADRIFKNGFEPPT